MDGRWVKRYFTKPGVQTWMELNGYPCIDTSEVAQRQQICTSRSFGEMVTTLDYLRASVATFAASCAMEGDALQPWKLKSEHKSPNYLTDLEEILTVKNIRKAPLPFLSVLSEATIILLCRQGILYSIRLIINNVRNKVIVFLGK